MFFKAIVSVCAVIVALGTSIVAYVQLRKPKWTDVAERYVLTDGKSFHRYAVAVAEMEKGNLSGDAQLRALGGYSYLKGWLAGSHRASRYGVKLPYQIPAEFRFIDLVGRLDDALVKHPEWENEKIGAIVPLLMEEVYPMR